MIMLCRFIFRLSQWLLICLPLMVLGTAVLAIVLPFIPASAETLPKALAWFDNYSGRALGYPAGDGLSGDPTYRAKRFLEGHTNQLWERYYWLALRNPINYFDYTILGHTYGEAVGITALILEGSMSVSDAPPVTPGFKYLELDDNGTTLYEYYYVSKAYTLFGHKYEFKVRFGHKIGNIHEATPGQTTQWVFDINPIERVA